MRMMMIITIIIIIITWNSRFSNLHYNMPIEGFRKARRA
jgi:hypothetical protein